MFMLAIVLIVFFLIMLPRMCYLIYKSKSLLDQEVPPRKPHGKHKATDMTWKYYDIHNDETNKAN